MSEPREEEPTSPEMAVPRTADGDVLEVAPLPIACARCRGPADAVGACRRRCDLDGRAVRKDGGEHPSGGGAE